MGAFLSMSREIWDELSRDEAFRMAAEASFYLIFSIFPLIFVVFVVLSEIGVTGVGSRLLGSTEGLFSEFVPVPTLNMIRAQLAKMQSAAPGRDILISVILFAWPASNVFYAYVDAVSRAYNAPNNRSYLRTRLLAFALLLISGMLFVLAFVALSLTPLILRGLPGHGIGEWVLSLLQMFEFITAFALITPSLVLIYKLAPDPKTSREHTTWPGAFLATTLWVLASYLFGVYIAYLDTYRALYGTLGGAMLLLMWMYITSLIVVLGAEFNVVYGKGDRGRGKGTKVPNEPPPSEQG